VTATLIRPSLGPPVPTGYRPAMHPMLWVAAVSEAAEFEHRSDAITRRTDLAWVLVDHTDWTTRTVACGWNRLAADANQSCRTVARALAWLRGEYLLAVVSRGSRPGLVNDPAVYVLLEPAPHL
jgi:hypothetical protein